MNGGAGIGYRSDHAAAFAEQPPPVALIEVHAENYLADGPARARLLSLRRDFTVSLHSVSLSLLGDGPDPVLLDAVAELAADVQPALVSVHLAWMGAGGAYLEGLYPFPRTDEALELCVRSLDRIQQRLGHRVLVENLAAMLDFPESAMTEPAFLTALAARTGCGLLLDVNNLVIAATNLGLPLADWLTGLPAEAVGQYHLAGNTPLQLESACLLADSHDTLVDADTWAAFRQAVAAFGPLPTIVEWDADIPPLQVLVQEAQRAGAILDSARHDR